MAALDYLVDDSGSVCTLFCKGHVTPDEFLAGVADYNRYQIDDRDETDWVRIGPTNVSHTVARWVPYGPNQTEFDTFGAHRWLDYPVKPGRGAFPVTLAEVG